jgi:hypothetical protein
MFQKIGAGLALAAALTTLFSITAFGGEESHLTSVPRTNAAVAQTAIKLPASASAETVPWLEQSWSRHESSKLWPWLSAEPAELWSLLIRSMEGHDPCKHGLNKNTACVTRRIEPRERVS